MHLRLRSLIAIVAAYGILLAAIFSAMSAGSTAAFGAPSFCRAADVGNDRAPLLPARQDLDCCVGCFNAPPVLPVEAAAGAVRIAFGRLVWAAPPPGFSSASVLGSPSARAPPAQF